MANMKADLVLRRRITVDEDAFASLLVWELPKPLKGSRHRLKYRLAYVVGDVCVLRYDNEAGKGDHKHINHQEVPYEFTSTEALLRDFWRDVRKLRP